MEPDKNTTPSTEGEHANEPQQAPADALSRTPEDLEQEEAEQATHTIDNAPTEKKVSPLWRFLRRINVYFLMFLLILVVAGVVTGVQYLNSQKPTSEPEPTIASQKLTEDALKQLANRDASVGSASQTLTIQGNAIIEGQTLMRGNLNVAGNFQAGGSIQGPRLTISGESNLGSTQANTLQVATNATVQGNTTLRDLSVAGTASFNGTVSAPQLTVSQLIISGTGTLRAPRISFAGGTPGRSINPTALGAGGTASVSGSDTTGTVNINTGGGPAAGCMVQLTFTQRFAGEPRVLISPVGAGAGLTQYYVTRDSGGFSICASSPPPAGQAFAFDYFVTTN